MPYNYQIAGNVKISSAKTPIIHIQPDAINQVSRKKGHSACFGLTSKRSGARLGGLRASAEAEPAGSPGSAACGSAPRAASLGSHNSTVPSRGMGPEDQDGETAAPASPRDRRRQNVRVAPGASARRGPAD